MWNSFGTVGANQGGFMDTSSPSTNRARKPAGTMSVVPCTVCELLNVAQSSDRFTTRTGIDVSNVMIVGVVRSMTRNADATYVEYTVDDHSCSSTIVVRHYQTGGEAGGDEFFGGANSFDDPRQSGITKSVAVGKYVRAFGMVRANPNAADRSKRILVTCYKLREVRDALELVRHRLELIHFRLALKSENNNASRSVAGSATQFSGSTGASYGQQPYGSTAGPAGGGAPQRGGSAVSEVQTFLRSAPPNGSGYSIQTITQALSGRFSEREVRAAIDFLQEEGIAYQTVDENTFSLVDM